MILPLELTIYGLFFFAILCLGSVVYHQSDHLLYSEFHSILQHRRPNLYNRYRVCHLTTLALTTFYIGRILFIAKLVMIQTTDDHNNTTDGFSYHSFGIQLLEYHVLRHIKQATTGGSANNHRDSVLLLSLVSIIVCAMVHYLYFYLRANPASTRKYTTLLMVNMDAYREALKPDEVQARILSSRVKQIRAGRASKGQIRSFISNLALQPLVSVLARWQHWTDVGSRIDMVRFAAHPLPYFPRMTLWVRLNYVRLCLAIDSLTCAFVRVAFICTACAWPSVQLYFGNRVPTWSRYLQLLDSLLLTYLCTRLTMLVSLFVGCSTLGISLYQWTMAESVRQVSAHFAIAVAHYDQLISSSSSSGSMMLVGVRRSITGLLVRHAHLCRVLLLTNRELRNAMLLVTVATQLPCNGYFVHHCIAQYRSMIRESLVDSSDSNWSWALCFMISVTVLQQAVVLVALLPLVRINKALHRPARMIPQLIEVLLLKPNLGLGQHQQPKQNLILALKCLSLYERLTSGRKYGAGLGSLKTITRRAVFQLAALYVVCLLNVIKFFIER